MWISQLPKDLSVAEQIPLTKLPVKGSRGNEELFVKKEKGEPSPTFYLVNRLGASKFPNGWMPASRYSVEIFSAHPAPQMVDLNLGVRENGARDYDIDQLYGNGFGFKYDRMRSHRSMSHLTSFYGNFLETHLPYYSASDFEKSKNEVDEVLR